MFARTHWHARQPTHPPARPLARPLARPPSRQHPAYILCVRMYVCACMRSCKPAFVPECVRACMRDVRRVCARVRARALVRRAALGTAPYKRRACPIALACEYGRGRASSVRNESVCLCGRSFACRRVSACANDVAYESRSRRRRSCSRRCCILSHIGRHQASSRCMSTRTDL